MTAQTQVSARSERRRGANAYARVAVIGATGYAGRELIALLARHPAVRLAQLASSGRDGKDSRAVEDWHPALRGMTEVPVRRLIVEDLAASGVDLVFLATPHEVSHEVVPALLESGVLMVDLSGAFRLKDAAAYARWYGFEHGAPEALETAVYGFPELNAAAIREARLVANPGCYATSVILALAPLLKAGVVDIAAGITCDSKSGATGAGRSLRDDLLFSNVNENCRAYALFSHRHVPEILQALRLSEDALTFVPHVLPVNRGILSTLYLRLLAGAGSERLASIFRDFYALSPFVRVYDEGALPEIRAVAHTCYADLGWVFDPRTRRLVIVSALDNLMKGAASQAVQNMNLMLGYAEDAGLK